jgi:hypothetical protein
MYSTPNSPEENQKPPLNPPEEDCPYPELVREELNTADEVLLPVARAMKRTPGIDVVRQAIIDRRRAATIFMRLVGAGLITCAARDEHGCNQPCTLFSKLTSTQEADSASPTLESLFQALLSMEPTDPPN